MENIPQKLQNQLAMLQQMQQQLQTVITQKAQYDMTIREARRALEDLADVPEDAAVFMNVGSVMMQKSKEKVVAALNERIETLELRLRSRRRRCSRGTSSSRRRFGMRLKENRNRRARPEPLPEKVPFSGINRCFLSCSFFCTAAYALARPQAA